MRILAIIAHDKKPSLTHSLFDDAVSYMRDNGYEVDVLDLYDRADDIPFFWHDKTKLESYPFFQENKERFMAADRLFIIFPVYWYSVPGILKCWIDLITSFAWKYEQGFYARPLHKITKTLFVSITLYPQWFVKIILRNPAMNQLKQTFKYMGIYHQDFFTVYDVKNMNEKLYAHTRSKLQSKITQLTE